MNTTMAPMDHARQDNIADLDRRHHCGNELPLRKRFGGGNSGGGGVGGGNGDGKRAPDSSGSGSGSGRGSGFGGGSGSNGGSNSRFGSGSNSKADSSSNNNKGSSGNSGGNGGGSGGGSGSGSNNNGGNSGNGRGGGNFGSGDGSGNGNGNRNGGRKALSTPTESSTTSESPSETSTPPPDTTATAATTVPTPIEVTSTTGAAASSSGALSEVSSVASTDSSLTLFPTTAGPDTSAPASTTPPDLSSQPRKGQDTDTETTKTSTRSISKQTSTTSANLVPESIVWPSPTGPALPAEDTPPPPGKGNSISPLTEHLLIAAGAIGAFIIIIAGVYLLSRMKKVDLFSVFRNREVRRSGPRGWYGWRRKSRSLAPLGTSETGFYGYPSDDKLIPTQRELDAFFSPISIPPKAIPQKASGISETDSQRRELIRETHLANPTPFGVTPQQMAEPGNPPLNTLNPNYNNTYNTNNTNITFRSGNTSEAYDPGQREVNHMSYLSSLSSGFGDAQIIIPESDITKQNIQGSRKSAHQSRKFSWVSSVPGIRRPGDRDTIYTRSSVESAPRYRTVNSWVAQQTGRVERRLENDEEAPSMPELPWQLQNGANHQRKVSEDPAFMHHPGDEIEFSRGSRVPSAILDRKIGVN